MVKLVKNKEIIEDKNSSVCLVDVNYDSLFHLIEQNISNFPEGITVEEITKLLQYNQIIYNVNLEKIINAKRTKPNGLPDEIETPVIHLLNMFLTSFGSPAEETIGILSLILSYKPDISTTYSMHCVPKEKLEYMVRNDVYAFTEKRRKQNFDPYGGIIVNNEDEDEDDDNDTSYVKMSIMESVFHIFCNGTDYVSDIEKTKLLMLFMDCSNDVAIDLIMYHQLHIEICLLIF